MKFAILLVFAVLLVASQAAHDVCGKGCAAAGADEITFCQNLCTSCDGHVHCNKHNDECECHGHDHTHKP